MQRSSKDQRTEILALKSEVDIIQSVFDKATVWVFLIVLTASAQLVKKNDTTLDEHSLLVDEDEDQLVKKEYVFNPLIAKKELKVGNFYTKKGNHRAAAARYLEATRWDPGYSHAYWRLGRSHEKLKKIDGAITAYQTYLKLTPDGKHANEVRNKIAELSQLPRDKKQI